MGKLFGMNERMDRAWKDGFGGVPPLFWLPFFVALLLWSIIWLTFCIAGWMIGFYGCGKCDQVKHRTLNKPKQHMSYTSFGDGYSHILCATCSEEYLRKKKERRTAPPFVPSQHEYSYEKDSTTVTMDKALRMGEREAEKQREAEKHGNNA